LNYKISTDRYDEAFKNAKVDLKGWVKKTSFSKIGFAVDALFVYIMSVMS